MQDAQLAVYLNEAAITPPALGRQSVVFIMPLAVLRYWAVAVLLASN